MNAAVGEVYTAALKLLSFQLARDWILCLLLTPYDGILLRVYRDGRCEMYVEYASDQVLQAYLTAMPVELGCAPAAADILRNYTSNTREWEELAYGGSAVTYRSTDKKFVLKVLRFDAHANLGDWFANETTILRELNEIEGVKDLVPRFCDAGESPSIYAERETRPLERVPGAPPNWTAQLPWIMMSYCGEQWQAPTHTYAEYAELVRILQQVHAAGFVHLDCRSVNVVQLQQAETARLGLRQADWRANPRAVPHPPRLGLR
eukprot:TRINITY_DN4439_c0_g1_i2.p2 TRINITY_DN4439_c0_g1~~TRINITY_DN4439_c0_g1_i2.p2  ORF type:complete len:262 (-),score=34.42 TRINITY_DN4439_c0_g1_i2:464-1249(-)